VNTAVNAAWTYLVVAGLFEIGWPLGLKWAQEAQRTPALVFGVVVAVVAMGISGFLLYSRRGRSRSAPPTRCGPASERRAPS
jgi:hypothetical protein